MLTFTIIFLFAVMLPTLIFSFVAFDILIRKLYQDHREEWEKHGRPCGMMWHAKETERAIFKSDTSMKKLQFVWLFITPDWIKNDFNATHWIRWFRFAVLFWNLSLSGL